MGCLFALYAANLAECEAECDKVSYFFYWRCHLTRHVHSHKVGGQHPPVSSLVPTPARLQHARPMTRARTHGRTPSIPLLGIRVQPRCAWAQLLNHRTAGNTGGLIVNKGLTLM